MFSPVSLRRDCAPRAMAKHDFHAARREVSGGDTVPSRVLYSLSDHVKENTCLG